MRLFERLRVGEVTLMLGFPMTGALFGLQALSRDGVRRTCLFLLATFFLFLAIYCFNEACGPSTAGRGACADDRDPSGRALGVVSVVVLAVAILLYLLLDTTLAWMAAISFLLWSAYSLPRVGLKGLPVTGTAVHLLGQGLHFHMGYVLFAPPSERSLLLSLYFALLFSAGHLNHEAIDYEADKSAGIRTGAVFFGRESGVRASSLLFGLAGVYWLALRIRDVTTWGEALPFLAVVPVQGLTWVGLRRSGAEMGALLRRYRARYRLYYLLAGIACGLVKLTSPFHGPAT